MVSFAFRVMLPPRIQAAWRSFRGHLVFNYITLHYIYYIVACLSAGIILWGSSTPSRSVAFIDCLFLVTSAMTEAGLNTVNLSELNTWQQFLLFFLMIIGSSVLISSAVVHARKKAFEAKLARVVCEERPLEDLNADTTSISMSRIHSSRTSPAQSAGDSLHGDNLPQRLPALSRPVKSTEDGIEGSPDLQHTPSLPAAAGRVPEILAQHDVHWHYVSSQPLTRDERRPEDHIAEANRPTSQYFESRGFIGRNSQFHSLSQAERERLGGVEYKAIKLLEKIVLCYFVLWQLSGCLGLGAWIAYHRSSVTLDNGLNPWWVGAFLGVSAFNNNGMSLLDANMVPFQSSHYVLITMALMILAGNTCYPVFLRLILRVMLSLLPPKAYFEDHRQTLKFLLDHPRRCYTHLFPPHHTWWLFGSLIVLNGIDWGAFEVLNINNHAIYTSPDALPVLDGLFQAVAVRSGGFYVVPIAKLSIGLLALYVLMMYISVYPVTITLRNSNVYEERSLGIYSDDPHIEPRQKQSWLSVAFAKLKDPSTESARAYFVRQQLRGQLAHDLWWLSLAVLSITIIETQQFDADPVTFSVFNIVFETVTAYGCVGISTGAPNVNFSFCGTWHTLSKLILCAVMLRGRHRGLPVAIDQAVLLPRDQLDTAEEEDAAIHREMAHERRLSRSRGISA